MKHIIILLFFGVFLLNMAYGATAIQVQNNCPSQDITAFSFDCVSSGGTQTANQNQTVNFNGLRDSCTYTLFAKYFPDDIKQPRVQTGQGGSTSHVILESQPNACICASGCMSNK